MAPIATTSFPAEAVPQAPEDPLFGLMRAYRADESKDKVDLVGHGPTATELLKSSPTPQLAAAKLVHDR